MKGNELPVHQITHFFQLILSNPKNCCIFAQIKTVVYPTGTQVKSLKFNNGDFSMPAFSPFRKKEGIISYYEYICN